MHLLVTGATGFVGQHLVRHLLTLGHDVTILLRESYGMGYPLPPSLAEIRPQIETVYADLRNFRLTVRAIQQARADTILHLAAAGVTDPYLPVDTSIRHNLNGTLNLVRACFEKTETTSRVIVARTPGERKPHNAYAASKAAGWKFCEMYAQSASWPIVGAMIFQAYGPGQPQNTLIPAAFHAALAGSDFSMTGGTQERDWIYVADVARGLAAMAETELDAGETFELGTGSKTTVNEVVEEIFALVGRGGRPRPGALPERRGEPRRQIANVAHTHAALNWKATYSFKEGLKRLLKLQYE